MSVLALPFYAASLVAVVAGAVGPGAMSIGLAVPQSATIVESPAVVCNATRVERAVWLMGTSLRATVCASSRRSGLAAIERGFEEVRKQEGILSTWRPESELSRLNDATPGEWVQISPRTHALLAEIRAWTRETDGAFDPAVGAAIDAWDLRGAGRMPSSAEIDLARLAAGLSAWELDRSAARVRRRAGVRIDAGAFGKGAGLRAALQVLPDADIEWAILDFGGQLTLWDRKPEARWRVAIADPGVRERPVAVLNVGPGSVATTAASERFVEVGGRTFGHVLDPRTAQPVPAWGGVTVVADDPVVADLLSTALFVLGREKALAWADGSRDLAVVVLEPSERGIRMSFRRGADSVASVGRLDPDTSVSTHDPTRRYEK